MSRYRIAYALACVFLLSIPGGADAQGLNYVDESGNIFFVDNINQVPMQYRNQFIAPRPTLSPDSRAGKEYERSVKRRQIEIERAKKKKEKVSLYIYIYIYIYIYGRESPGCESHFR